MPYFPPLGSGAGAGSDGASAYDLAVAGGFTGTVVEWLASLQGTDGAGGASLAESYKGEWAADVSYAVGDLVGRNGGLYSAFLAQIGTDPAAVSLGLITIAGLEHNGTQIVSLQAWSGALYLSYPFVPTTDISPTHLEMYAQSTIGVGAILGLSSVFTASSTVPWLTKHVVTTEIPAGSWFSVPLDVELTLPGGSPIMLVVFNAGGVRVQGDGQQIITGMTLGPGSAYYGSNYSSSFSTSGVTPVFHLRRMSVDSWVRIALRDAPDVDAKIAEQAAVDAATYAPRGVVPTGRALVSPVPVTITAATPPGTTPSGMTAVEVRDLTGSALNAWFSTPVQTNSAWNTTLMVYPFVGASVNPPMSVMGFQTSSARVRILGSLHTGRNIGPWVFVDGHAVSYAMPNFGLTYAGSYVELLITFPDARSRTIEVMSPWAIRLVATDTAYPPTAYTRAAPSLAFIGDSWIGGTSQGGALSIPALMQASNPWRIWANGSGGSGYTAAGSGLAFVDAARLDALLNCLPDVLLIFGSINDGATSLATALATILARRTALSPTTKLVFVGPQLPSDNQRAGLAQIIAATNGNANVLGVIDPTPWVTTGITGPTDFAHPSPLGVQVFASNLAVAVRALALASGDTRW